MIVGLTGRSCSGKDRFASLLDDSFFVIDEDAVGHLAYKAKAKEIAAAFGPETIGSDGSVDRRSLSKAVFGNEDKLRELESIMHPWMKEETMRKAAEAEGRGKIVVINAAILERMGFLPYCDVIVYVISSYENRLKRAMERDGATPESFRKRSDAQNDIGKSLFSSGKKIITIVNDSDEEALSRQAAFFCATLEKGRLKA